MPRRSYDQYCGLARALDVLGERWTLLVVRNLLLGPQRYSELLRGLPGITTNLLAKRLQEMEAEGLVERGDGTSDATAYRLTDLGRELEPAIHALGRWGWRRMGKPTSRDRRSVEWLLVALRRRYRGDVTLSTELEADGIFYHIVMRGNRAEIGRGRVPAPDLRIRGKGIEIARLFLDGLPRDPDASSLEIDGNARQLRTLIGAFESGDPAIAAAR
ncbi:MAG TPA: helix-turn-helix domain-containing protein [Gemmatimonadaceae bacterium]|jgi:DNA-binding HxlR family transcriptional regulator|nr:helix-turn-helix domain-containing protein [Gemmatimonadaceae bacterium]